MEFFFSYFGVFVVVFFLLTLEVFFFLLWSFELLVFLFSGIRRKKWGKGRGKEKGKEEGVIIRDRGSGGKLRGRAGRGGGGKKDRTSSCAQIFVLKVNWSI